MTNTIGEPGTGEFIAVDPDFEFAKNLVREVGELVRSGLQAGYVTTWKEDITPVTDIDIAVNQRIIEVVHQAYPTDRIYGEEASLDGESGYTWVVDPIDGTQSLGIVPTSTVCLARTDQEGQPLFGVVYNPDKDELFAARRGEKSTLNGQVMQVSEKSDLKGSYIFLGSRLPEKVASNGTIYDRVEGQGGKIWNVRSLAFGCVMVASGKADGAYLGIKTPFEAAAVKLIVEGAGGKVTDLYGNAPVRLDGEMQGMVVSNGLVHNALLSALQKD